MAIRSGTVLPGVSPVRAREDECQRGVLEARLSTGSMDENLTPVTRTESRKHAVLRAVVVHPRSEPVDGPRDHVELHVVQGAGTGSGAEQNFAAGVPTFLRDASRIVEQAA